jgi:hypothetical protein
MDHSVEKNLLLEPVHVIINFKLLLLQIRGTR